MKRVLLSALCTLLLSPAVADARAKWDVSVLAHVPPPGYPALSLIAPDRTIYVGTFTNATGDADGPSHLYAYSPEGLMLRDWTIQGQSADGDNGIQVAAQDAGGKLYLLDQQPPRVLTFDPHTGEQSTYATFSDVPSCPPGGAAATDCSDTVMDNPPEPDYAAWGPDGSLYVTDYTQGLIWRVPPGGGEAKVWFTDPQLDGTEFGPAGIVLMPDHKTVLLDTSAGGATSVGNPTTGKLYTLPIGDDGSPGQLKQLWESGPAQAPDGFALAQSGNVYVALVGPGTNQLVEISPSGEELGRTPATPLDNQMLSVPFDEPSSVQFDGDRMIVTNDAYFSGDETHWVLYDVWAGEPGAPVYVPGE
jgi:DNA-binding beta-propeller fold protein YncE